MLFLSTFLDWERPLRIIWSTLTAFLGACQGKLLTPSSFMVEWVNSCHTELVKDLVSLWRGMLVFEWKLFMRRFGCVLLLILAKYTENQEVVWNELPVISGHSELCQRTCLHLSVIYLKSPRLYEESSWIPISIPLFYNKKEEKKNKFPE